jgi:23S rRNA (uracil1939-C5)-methyltransferase
MNTGISDEIIENVSITDLGVNGAGIGRAGQMVVFVKNTVPGDVVDISKIIKKRRHIEARAINFRSYSDKRTVAFCKHAGICGGCAIQHLNYEFQLQLKHKIVSDAFERIGHFEDLHIPQVMPSPQTTLHKNKLEFSFSNARWLLETEINSDHTIKNRDALGFHYPGKFDKIVDISECFLQPDPSNELREFVRKYATSHQLSFYDIRNNSGFLRSLMIRTSGLGETMVALVFGEDDQKEISGILNAIKSEFSEINSIWYFINLKKNDSLYDQTPVHFYGSKYIFEQVKHVKVQLGPKSFYQTNSAQALNLYQVASDFASLQSDETLYDLYSGVGSIALFMASQVKKVVGIETVPDSVEEAAYNAQLNNIPNAVFLSGLVEDVFTPEFVEAHGPADVVVIDPPRPGIHPRVVESILEVAPARIVYVSCNPATQARDIAMLSQKYEIVKMQPVDMFPHTFHVENVVLLKLKEVPEVN